MPFMNSPLIKRKRSTGGGGGETGDGDGILPYIGIADWDSPRTGETILSLRELQRGPNPSVVIPPFTVEANDNDGYWLAYPKIYGLARFKYLDDNMADLYDITWDGAKGNPIELQGPVEVEIVIDGVRIPFYINLFSMAPNVSSTTIAVAVVARDISSLPASYSTAVSVEGTDPQELELYADDSLVARININDGSPHGTFVWEGGYETLSFPRGTRLALRTINGVSANNKHLCVVIAGWSSANFETGLDY